MLLTTAGVMQHNLSVVRKVSAIRLDPAGYALSEIMGTRVGVQGKRLSAELTKRKLSPQYLVTGSPKKRSNYVGAVETIELADDPGYEALKGQKVTPAEQELLPELRALIEDMLADPEEGLTPKEIGTLKALQDKI